MRFLPVALLAFLPALFSSPAVSAQGDPIPQFEDWGPFLAADVDIDTPSGTEKMGFDPSPFMGYPPDPVLVGLDYSSLGDWNGDGLEEIQAGVGDLEIEGYISSGSIRMGVEPMPFHPDLLGTGEIREITNPTSGYLDVDEQYAGNVSFDMYLELEFLNPGVLHAHDPVHIEGVTHRPPQPGETLSMVGGPVTLYDDAENPTAYAISGFSLMGYAPDAVGGIAELVADSDAPAGAPASSGGSALPLAAVAGAALALVAGAWYVVRLRRAQPR